MQESNLLSEGTQLAIIGMGTVFFFLTTLVFATIIMSRIIILIESRSRIESNEKNYNTLEEQKIAAAAIAVHNYRNQIQKK